MPSFGKASFANVVFGGTSSLIAVGQSAQTTATATGTTLAQAFAGAVVAGSTLCCFVECLDVTSETISVSDSVNGSWGAAVRSVDDGTKTVAQFQFQNTAAGTPTVTATFGVTTTVRAIWIVEVRNAAVSSLDGFAGQNQASPGAGTDAVTSGNATNAKQPALIVALSSDHRTISPVAPAAGTGFVDNGAGWTFSGGNQARLESKRVTTATAIAATFTGTSGVVPTTLMALFDELGSSLRDCEPWCETPNPVGKAPRTVDQSGFAPVGTLITTVALTSLGWFAVPHRQPVVVPQTRVEVTAPVGTGIFAPSQPRWIDPPQIPTQPQRIERPQPSQPTGPLAPFVSASVGFGLYADIPYDLPLVFRQPGSDNAPVGSLLTPSVSTGFGLYVALPFTTPPTRAVDSSAPIGLLIAATLPLGWHNCDAPPRSSLVAPRAQQPIGGERSLQPFVSASTGWFPSDYRTAPTVTQRVDVSAPTGPLSPFLSVSTGFFGSSSVSPVLPPPRAQDSQQPTGPLKPFVSASSGFGLYADIPVDLPLILRQPISDNAPVGSPITAALTSLGWLQVDGSAPVSRSLVITATIAAEQGPLKPFLSLSIGFFGSSAVSPVVPAPRAQESQQPPNALTPFVSASTGFFGSVSASPVVPAPRSQESAQPVSPLVPFVSTSSGWQSTPPLAPQAKIVAAAQLSAPVGSLIAPLTSIGWLGPDARTPVLPAPRAQETSGPTGPLNPFLSASTGFFGTTSVSPLVPAPRAQETVQPNGPLSPFVSLSTGFFGSSSKSPVILAPRAQESAQPTGPLVPFVSISTGWLRQDLPVAPPLFSRTVSDSSPVGSLLPGALTSLGWLGADVVKASGFAPRLQNASSPTGPLVPFLSTSTGFFGSTSVSPVVSVPKVQDVAQPVGPLKPFVSPTLGWLNPDSKSPFLPAPRAQEAQQPVGALSPFLSLSTGFFGSDSKSPIVPAPRAQEAQQPTGPLKPFVSPTLGWMTADLIPDLPLIPRQVSDSSPVGTLLTPQPFSWNSALEQARPAPIVSRRVEPAAPVGTAFAVALPSNGWLATDNPRTPLALGKSTPQDPVGSLLVPAPLIAFGWFQTDNPRTPYSVTRAVIVDPVGSSIPLPGQHGPFWFIDQSRSTPGRTPAVDASAPVGTLFATLTSVGWLSPFEAPRSPLAASRVQPAEALRALQFGGAPWATVDVLPGRAAAARAPEASQPTGSLRPFVSASTGWFPSGLPAHTALQAPRAQDPAAPVSALQPFVSASTGWMSADYRTAPLVPSRVDTSAPVGPLQPFVSLSSGWQATEQQRTRSATISTLQPSQAHSALAFGGAPWAVVDTAQPRTSAARGQETAAPVGLAFAGALTSLGWLRIDSVSPLVIVQRLQPNAPIGNLLPQVFLPSMGWQSHVDLPPKWSFVARPIPSEPVGSSFALAFRVAPTARCSPVFDASGAGRVSPVWDVSGAGRQSPVFDASGTGRQSPIFNEAK